MTATISRTTILSESEKISAGLLSRNAATKIKTLNHIEKHPNPRWTLGVRAIVRRTTSRAVWLAAMEALFAVNIEVWAEMERSHPWGGLRADVQPVVFVTRDDGFADE